MELEDQSLGSSHLPEPSQHRQGGISDNVEQGHLALVQAQPLMRHCSWREPDRTYSPRFASHLSSNPLGLTRRMYHGRMRRPNIVKRYLMIWTVFLEQTLFGLLYHRNLTRDNQIQWLKQRTAKYYGPGDCWRCPELRCLWEVACEDERDRKSSDIVFLTPPC